MNYKITIAKNQDSSIPEIVYPKTCLGCYTNPIGLKDKSKFSSKFVTSNDLNNVYNADIIHISDILHLLIPQKALWFTIPVCFKCHRKARNLKYLMYFFEFVTAVSLALAIIFGLFLSEAQKEDFLLIVGPIYGIALWATAVSFISMRYILKIKLLAPDAKGISFRIRDEKYANEFSKLNQCDRPDSK